MRAATLSVGVGGLLSYIVARIELHLGYSTKAAGAAYVFWLLLLSPCRSGADDTAVHKFDRTNDAFTVGFDASGLQLPRSRQHFLDQHLNELTARQLAYQFWLSLSPSGNGAVIAEYEMYGKYDVFTAGFDAKGALVTVAIDCATRRIRVVGVAGDGQQAPATESTPSGELRARALALCDGVPATDHCGHEDHMFDEKDWSGGEFRARDHECIRERHVRNYGRIGMPDAANSMPLGALEPLCEDHCVEPCASLNGRIRYECGMCQPTMPSIGCHPGAPGFPKPVERPGDLAPFGAQGQLLIAVREVRDCNDTVAEVEAVLRGLPLVLRGCLHTRSPKTMLWTDDQYVIERAEDEEEAPAVPQMVGGPVGGPDRSDPCVPLRHYFRSPRDGLQVRICTCPGPLLRDVQAPSPLQHGSLPAGFRVFYDKTLVWHGPGGTSSDLHYDPNGNFMHVVEGEKHLLLVDPVQSPLLYSDFADAASGISPVDPFRVDLGRFPLVAKVSLHVMTLRAGDIGYIPSGWWHLVVTPVAARRNTMLTLQFVTLAPKEDRKRFKAAFSADRAEALLARRYAAHSTHPWTLRDLRDRARTRPTRTLTRNRT